MSSERITLSIAKFENWPNDDLFSIQQVADEAYTQYKMVRNNAEAYALLYVCSGQLVVNQNGIDFSAQAGDTVLLPRHTAHLYYSVGKEPLRMIQTTVCGLLCDALYDFLNLQRECVYRQLDSGAQLKSMLSFALRPLPLEERIAYCCGKVNELFYRMHQQIAKLDAATTENTQTGVRFVKVVIDRHLDVFYTNAELAEFMKCSISGLVKKFKAEYGVTPMAYQDQTKIAAVKQQLKNPELSVKEISNQLGFCDPTYLSSYFKKHTGITTRAYRQELAARKPGR